MTRRAVRASALVAALVLAAGCGSSPSPSQGAASTPTAEASRGEGPASGAYGAAEQTPGGTVATPPGSVRVVDYAFTPAEITVRAGETVTWTFADEAGHDVTATDQSFVSEVLGSGGTYSFTFPRAGTFEYFCSIHPSMKGAVVVQ